MGSPRTLDPQIVGQAENAHRPVLDRLLARTGTSMTEWVALKLLAGHGGSLGRDQLVVNIADALRIDPATARQAIDGLTRAGLLRAVPAEPAFREFTPAGRARFEHISGVVRDVVARAYADIPGEDLVTAARVLTQITVRLTAEQAATDD